MSRRYEDRRRGEGSRLERRQQAVEDEIIPIPEFDFTDLIEKHKLTLVGRMFHVDGRSVDALIKHMPKRHIWDVEGKVRGTNLGNNKFQFDFDSEHELHKVLQRRPCHFNKWSFSLERWLPTIREDFPNSMLFWIEVSGVPNHYKKDETFRNIGKAMGLVESVDVEGGRVRVHVNGDEPLQFSRRAGFANGDVIRVSLKYENLHKYCFTCKRISHEEGTCPELSDGEKEKNRLERIVQKEKEERATKEAFSLPARHVPMLERSPGFNRVPTRSHGREDPKEIRRVSYSENGSARNDLRDRIREHRESHNKSVWNRLDREKDTAAHYPRDRENYHPYKRDNGQTYRENKDNHTRIRPYQNRSSSKPDERNSQSRRFNPDSQSANRVSPDRLNSSDSQRTISAPLEVQRGGGGRNSRDWAHQLPHRSTKEWRPISPLKPAGDHRREVSNSVAKVAEEERVRRLKGKAIAQEPAPRPSKFPTGRGILIIRDPDNKTEKTQEQSLKELARSESMAVEELTGNGRNVGKTGGQSPGICPEGPGQQENLVEEDEELMDEDAFDKMVELYTDPNQDANEEMLDIDAIDDLIEEERAMEAARKEKDTEPQHLSDTRAQRQEGAVKRKTGEYSERERLAETFEITTSDDVQTDALQNHKVMPPRMDSLLKPEKGEKIVGSKGTQTAPPKRKKGTRSPDAKGAAASKKLAARGRASPKSKVARQLRTSRPRSTSQLPRIEVYPSALKGGKPSVSGSMVSQKPSSTHI
ncbi:hypothetical protein N665_0554s0014 [Sinapis alba]|nr:hypothetical protein N665_0554s0014 [Sinapis alba]